MELKVCNGKITAKDNSSNDPNLVRTYELYYNNTLVESPLTSASDTTRFLSDVQPGLTYEVKIKIFSTPNRPGSNGYVYVGTKTLTIPATPSLSANLSTVCAGKEVRLTAAGGGSYQWSSGSQTTSQISVYPTGNTTYTVSVTQSANCVATRSISINVHPTPAVSIDPTSPICVGSSVQLRARGSGGTPGYVYNWSRDNGDQSTFAGSTSGEIVSVQPSVSTGYRVTITDGNGCESTAQTQVVVNPNPTATIDPIPPLVNAGSSVTLIGRGNGGTPPYQYRWSNNATTSSINITATTTTTYSLTITDNKTCSAVAQVQVNVSTRPVVTIAPVAQPICPGAAVLLQGNVSGGTSPYSYRWSNGATTISQSVNPQTTTTYGLTVTDQQGKKDSTQLQVQVNPKPIVSIQGTQPNCVGQSTVLTASGGSTYLWTGGATTASITVNPAQSTTYYVTVKNTHNCSAVDSFRVIVPAAIQLGYGLQNDQDCTPNNVTVVPSPLNAQAPLSYSMQRNGTTTLNPSLSNLTTDNFTLTVTDSKGCTASTLVSINEAAPLRITLSKEREHDCTPGNTKINVSTTGARGAVSYRLDGGEPYNFATYLNIPNGLHTVTAQDAFGCVASDTVRIAEDSLLVVAEPLIKQVTCPDGSDGSISLQVRGGTGIYYFNWSNLGSSTHVLSNIQAGNYSVTVVDSRNCQVTKTINVTEPGDIGFGAQRIVKHVTCYGGSDGLLEVTTPFSGGTAPYNFLWSNGATTNIASNLSRGQYGVTITDAKGCQTAFWSTGISEPAPISINSTGQYTNDLDCIANNVSINVTATGGRGGYTYSLNGGVPQNSGIFTGQSNGTHQLVVKDSANCSQTFNIQVVEQAPFTLGYRLENDQDCIANNTTIVPLPQNAQGAVSYLLFRGNTINSDPDLSGRSSGTYILSGRDSKGCSAGVTFTINEKIPPLPIRLDTLTVCAGVSATMSVQGAPTSGVSYVWTVPAGANNPGNVASFSATVAGMYSVVMTDTTTGCSISAQGEVRHTPGPDPDLCCSESICTGQSTYLSSNNYTPLSFAWSTGASTRGISVNPVQNTTYTLTVTDAAGCKGTAQVSVQILPKPSVRIDSVPPICSGDTITLRAVVSSGTAPYVYYWGSGSSSSTFKVSPSSTSTYTVSITDANGCMASAQVVVPVRTRPNVELGADQIVCTGTNATLRADVLNGTAPFTYAWSNGATQSLINVVPSTTTTYTVTVTDAIGCKSSDQVTVQVNPRPILNLGSDPTICEGTSTTIPANLSGGTAPFTYNWSNGSSANSLTVNPTTTSTYTLTVTDQKGCLAIRSITVNVLPRPTVNAGADRAICVGSSTTLNATASSANPPLTYAWSTGASTSSLSLSPSTTTTYTVTVTDGRACSQIDTIVVVINTPNAGTSSNSSACVGQNTTLTATGGGTYLWSTGASTSSIVVSPSTTSTYTVTVTNQGCSDTATHVLNVPTTNVTLIAPNIFNTTDCQTGNIAYEVKYTGSSTPGLEFRMNEGAWQSSTWFTNRSAGTYLIEGRVVTPTCILSLNSRSGSVTEASGATVIASLSLANENDCTTGNTAITVNLTQSVLADYRLYPSPNWNTSKTFTNRSSGKYIVEVRPRNSSVCMERDTIEFDEKTASITSVNITGHDDCVQGNLRIEVAATGTLQSGPLQYRLNSSYSVSYATAWQNSNVFSNPANGSFLNRAEVKTSSGCIFVKNIDIAPSEVDPLNLSITGLTYVSGATDCIKGNTRVNITTSTGPGVSVSQWRINGGAWTWSPEFYGLGRDSIFVEVRAYDDTRSCEVGRKLFVNERSIPDITQLVLSQQDDCVLGNAQISTQKTGGEGTISYKLNTGSFGSNPVFSNLSSGNHLVTVRDGNTCQDTMSVRITEPALMATTTSKANESDCTAGNASITVSATGARGTLSYSINGSTPQASNIFNNLSNGTYTVTAQDGVCTISKTVSVTESGALIATPFKTGENDCVVGNTSVAIDVTGALSTLSYRLDGGTPQASNVFNNLGNGSHTISVQDAGGCSTSTTFTVNEPSGITLGFPQIRAVKCYGEASGSLGLNVSGGVTPYTITWSNGAQGAFIQNLSAGDYAFTVTDSRGCRVSAVAPVPSPSAFQVQLSNFVDVACHNGTTGAISTTITGGMSPYTYRWSNSATTTSISNVAAGNYGLTVTDANGCAATATGSLVNPAPLSLSHELDNEQDCIANNLSITAIASGGRGNYAFSLNGGTPQASGLFTGKTTGTYTLTLQDGAGCSTDSLVLELSEAQPLGLSHQLLKDQDCITNNAEVVPSVTGGTGIITFSLLRSGEGAPLPNLNGLKSGTYLLKAQDSKGCIVQQEVVIQETPVEISALILSKVDDCIPGNTQLDISTKGDRLPLVYRLDGVVQSGATITLPREEKTYSIEVADAAGCVVSREEYYEDYDAVHVTDATSPVTDCSSPNGAIYFAYVAKPGSNQSNFSLSVDGGTTWHQGVNWVGNLRPGMYQTAARNDLAGCVVQGPQVQITAPNCLPEAGFTKDTLMVRSTTQRIALPWRVDKRAWGNADKPFSLRIYREGDGKPHFVDPNVATLLEPEEKNRGLAGRVIEYGVDFEGNDELVLTLQPEAGDYLEPGVYTFSLEASDGLKIDPLRQQLRVFVVLDPTTTIGGLPECSEAIITLTAPEESECYIWEGVTARTDERTVRVPYKSGAVYKVHMVKDLKTKTHVFFAEDLISPFEISAKDAAGKTIYDKKVCPGERIQLVVSSKANSNSSDWTFTWETLSNTGENYVTLAKTTTFLATAHNRVKNCSLSQEITIEVEDAGFNDPKLKPNPLVFCNSDAKYPGKNIELEVTNPVDGVTYSWHFKNATGQELTPILGTKAQVNLYKIGFGVHYLKMFKQVQEGHLCEKKLDLNITGKLENFANKDDRFYQLPLGYVKPILNKEYTPIGSGGLVEFVGKFADYEIRNHSWVGPTGSLSSALSNSLTRFSGNLSKKIFVIDESAVCEDSDVISKALEEIKKYQIGIIVLGPSNGGGENSQISILGLYQGNIFTPVSPEHRAFINDRFACIGSTDASYSAYNLILEVIHALFNYYKVEIQADPTEDLCSSNLVLKPKVTPIVGNQTYKYKWSNGSTSSSITVAGGLETQTFSVTATDNQIQPAQQYDGNCGPVGTFDLEPSNSNACAIQQYFEQRKDNFFSIPITVQETRIQSPESELRAEPCDISTAAVVENAAGSVNFEIYGTRMSASALATSVGTTLAQFSSIFGYKNARAIITSNESFCKCDNYQSVIDAFLDGAELGFWFHIFSPKNSPDVACTAFTGGDDKLYIQARFTGGPIFPGGPGDVDYLRMMEEYLKNKSLIGPKMISHLQREMLPEVSEAKTPQVFDKEDPEKNKLPKEQSPDDRCRMGFNAASINVIVPSGHVVALPANSVARFDHNPLTVNKFANGVVTGFTIFKNGKPVQIYHSFNKRSTPDHIGFFAAEEESPVSGAGYPFGVPEKNANGDVDLTVGYFIQEKRPNYNCNEFFDIKSALIQPTKPLISRPFGTLIKQLPEAGKIHKEQNKAFYPICSGVKLGEAVAQLEASGGGDLSAILDYNSSTPGIYYRFTDPLTKRTVWLYVTKKDGQTYYWTWNCVLAGWLQYTDPIDAESIIKIERLNKLLNSQVLKQGIHNALDIIGFVPVLGDIADLANASLYAIEGNWTQAGISVAFIIAPNLLKAGRYIKGAGKWLSNAGLIQSSVKAVYKFVDCATVAGEPELRSTPECQIAVKILNQAIENLNKAEVSPAAIDKIIGILEKSLDDVNLSGLDDISEKLITWFNASPDKVADFCKIVAKGVDDVQLPDADLLKLVDDLVGNPGFFDVLKGNNGLVKAWKYLVDARPTGGLRIAPEVLAAVSRNIDNPLFITKIGKETFQSILKEYAGPCSTCGEGASSIVKELRSVDQMLDNLQFFVLQIHKIVPNSDQVIAALQSTVNFQHGASYIMDFLRRGNFTSSNITKFEVPIDGARADIHFVTRLGEFKSWAFSSIEDYKSYPVSQQLLSYWAVMPNSNHFFDFHRLKETFSTVEEATEAVKKIFVDHFKYSDNAYLLWDKNSAFIAGTKWKNTTIEHSGIFVDLLRNDKDFWQSHVFNFIIVN